nr:MAG TPA: hypothetical protein [Bacteriophage sp.]
MSLLILVKFLKYTPEAFLLPPILNYLTDEARLSLKSDSSFISSAVAFIVDNIS